MKYSFLPYFYEILSQESIAYRTNAENADRSRRVRLLVCRCEVRILYEGIAIFSKISSSIDDIFSKILHDAVFLHLPRI